MSFPTFKFKELVEEDWKILHLEIIYAKLDFYLLFISLINKMN